MRNRRTARAATLTVLMSGAALAAAGAAQADTGTSPQPAAPNAGAQDTLQGLPVVGDLAKVLPTQAISGLIPGGLPTDQVLGNLPAAADTVTGAASRALPADSAGNSLPTDGLPVQQLIGGLPLG
ncbi:hypothetical protein G3I34_14940 [Streptomyces sp. SID8014]|uniref:hypothetical protein n=1 Tax=Streptomyces sp. SID8014 TaxID=2706097 RepID=UPI0013BA7C5C|nr:hypothetical protein [Streptomyces sp. SID8014]NEC13555.1 hypothetical protein [Streptomyces sp. SID8014]